MSLRGHRATEPPSSDRAGGPPPRHRVGEPPSGHRAGQPEFRRLSIALFVAGAGTFAMLYSVQPLLPVFGEAFAVSPAASSLTLAVTTVGVAAGILPAGWLSDAVGRTAVMRGSLVISALLGLLCAAVPGFEGLLVLRALQGVALAGLPAVAMAYLSEEVDAGSLGLSVGLYIGGNAIGGMAGRLLAGLLADLGGWRLAILGIGVMGAVCTVLSVLLLPASRRFTRRRELGGVAALRRLREPLGDRALLLLNAMGVLLMGTFVAVFNGIGFRLAAPPYGLSQTAIGAIFLVYPIGSLSSTAAGRLADRIGRRRMLPLGVLLALAGLALSAPTPLPFVVAGVAVLTAGFFAAHAIAASWVGRRAAAATAQASGLYVLSQYAGSSLAGPVAGSAWQEARWTGVMVVSAAMLAAALAVALRLRRIPPLGPAS